MKKLLSFALVGSSLMVGSNSAKADFSHYSIKSVSGSSGIEIYTCVQTTGVCTKKITSNFQDPIKSFNAGTSYIDEENNLIIHGKVDGDATKWIKYDYKTNSLTKMNNWKDDYEFSLETKMIRKNADGTIQIGTDENDIDVVADGLNIDGAAVITKNTDGTIQIGTDENDIDITSEGIAIDGDPLITKKANGELHIGKNSWITKEEGGRQKVWARDAAGNAIPIDYTNGTKLLINGRDVEQSINNVGALSAALTGLPTVPTDTTLACGLGTGTHGGDFAFSGGCASKVNEKLSINYAASMTMLGQDYAGDFEDQFSARAGFVWKLGKASKPTQISMRETKELKEEIADLKENNKNIIAQNNALLARLERLEKVALGDLKSKDLAVYKLK